MERTDPKEYSLGGLHYQDESYFDFVVAERPIYTPGSGPSLAPVSLLPPHDKDGIILEKAFIDKALRYIVSYENQPHLRFSVEAQNILKWVSSRTLERWESDDYERREREQMEIELPGILAKEAAKKKRMEKMAMLSRGGRPGLKIDGRRKNAGARKKRKPIQVDDGESAMENNLPRKRGRRGRPRKSSNVQVVLPSSPQSRRKETNEIPYTSPRDRRLSQHSSQQPSLSTPRAVQIRGLTDAIVLDSEETGSDEEDDEEDIDRALEAQLNSEQLPDRSNTTSPGLIGGRQSVAATSSREALNLYESIERMSHRRPDNTITMDRSPFRQNSLRSRSTSLAPPRTSTRQKSSTPIYTPPPPPPEDEDEGLTEDEWEIETILDDSMRIPVGNRGGRRVPHYLIHWKGCPINEATWEPQSNVGALAIKQYERRKASLVQKRAPVAPLPYVSLYAQPAILPGAQPPFRVPMAPIFATGASGSSSLGGLVEDEGGTEDEVDQL